MPVVTNRNEWKLVNQSKNQSKGPLIKVEIGPNQFVKMYESDAIEQGLIKPKIKKSDTNKMRPPGENKILSPGEDKNSDPEKSKEAETQSQSDDFTIISGLGKATQKALNARGINTFEELKIHDLSFLSDSVQESIKEWISQNG